jgi:predicted transcriptional regulator
MSAFNIRLPESLHRALRELAEQEGVSMNQFITQALAEKIAALQTEEYLQKRGNQGSRTAFETAMSKVPDIEPERDADRLD